MNNIRIITDSGSDIIPGSLPGVHILPMTVRFGEQEYQDGVNLTATQFYEKLIESDELPATSLVSPGAFAQAFEEAEAAGEEVLAITISGKLSGTYGSAVLAAQGHPGRVFVVDSKSVAVGQRILVLRALELAAAGLPAAEIAAQLEQEKTQIHVLAVLDTLEYLKKGGRISGTVAFVGGVLSIKPVVAVKDGAVAMVGKARGSKNANNHLIREVESTAGIDFSRPLCLGYTGLSDAMLQKYIADSEALWAGNREKLNISSIGATIGTHIGPGAVAIGFFEKH